MGNSNLLIRKKYLAYLENIIKDGHFQEVFKILNDFGLAIKVEHEYYSAESVDIMNTSTLCYIFDNKLIDEFSYLATSRRNKYVLSSKEKAIKYFELANKFNFLYSINIFHDFENYVDFSGRIIEIKTIKRIWPDYDSEVTFKIVRQYLRDEVHPPWPHSIFFNGILFSIEGIGIFNFNGHHYYYSVDNSFRTKDYFVKNIKQNTDLISILDMDWFTKLSSKSQTLITSGSQFLDKMFVGQLDELFDFTPLLLNFSKALEAEIKDYYDNNFSFIWPIAELILSNEIYLRNSQVKDKYHVSKLFSICREIVRFKENFSPSGHKPLPYILHYMGLGNDIDDIIDIDGFLSGVEREKVQKETALINRLFDTANNRNNYMHQTAIESKNEFLLHYFDIFQALNLLATIK